MGPTPRHMKGEDTPTEAIDSSLRPNDTTTFTIQGFVVVGVVLCGYLCTMYPTLPPGDSGEIITAAYHLGVAHPPGYPLFTLVGHAFTHLNIGNIAYRVNLSSVVIGALAAGVLYAAVARLTRNTCAALFAPLMFSFSPLCWLYSVHGEVFAVNHFLIAALFYLAIRYLEVPEKATGMQGGSPYIAYLGAFVCGLGACNQHTLVFYAAPTTLLILYRGWRTLFRPRCIVLLILSLAMGFSPYLQTVWASGLERPPPGTWGDLSTLDGFLTHFLRRQYGTFRLGSAELGTSTVAGMFIRINLYLTSLLTSSLYIGIPLFLVGAAAILYSPRLRRTGGALLLFCYVFYVIAFHALANLPIDKDLFLGVQARFYMQAHMVAFVVMAVGLVPIARLLHLSHRTLLAITLCLVAIQIGVHVRMQDQHDNYYTDIYGRSIMKPLKKNSLVLVKGDLISNSLRYFQLCENERTDLQVLDMALMQFRWYKKQQAWRHHNVTFPGTHYHIAEPGAFSIAEFIAANFAIFKNIYVCGGWYEGDHTGEALYDLWPVGHCCVVKKKGRNMKLKKYIELSEKAMPNHPLPDVTKYLSDTWEYVIASDDFEAHHRLPYECLMYAINHDNDQAALVESVRLFEALKARCHPMEKPHLYKNLGIAYGRLFPQSRSLDDRNGMISSFREYLEIGNDLDDPNRADIRKVLEPYEGIHLARPTVCSR